MIGKIRASISFFERGAFPKLVCTFKDWNEDPLFNGPRQHFLSDEYSIVFVCLFVCLFLFSGMKYEEALEQHKLALEVLKTVTKNHPETHPDYTFYLMNIGTCYHELGYYYIKSVTQKEKGRK